MFECGTCPSRWQNVVILFATCIVGMVLIVLIIKATLNATDQKNNPCSIYLKILISHMQLIYLVSTFDFHWPSEVRSR